VCDLFTNMDYDGIQDWSGEEYLFAMEGARGLNAVSKYKSDPLRIGLTSWTAHAYYTFHLGPDRDNRMRGGMMDGFRTPNPSLQWYRTEMMNDPLVIIGGTWQAGIERLRVYSNCEEVELRVNGQFLGRQRRTDDPRKAHLKSPEFLFEIDDYQDGELVALGLIGGEVKARDRVHTPQEPVALQLRLDMKDRQLIADGSDIAMVYAYTVDAHGTILRDAKTEVTFSVRGPAGIVGDSLLPDANPIRPVRHGVAPALIRAGTQAGLIVVRAEAPGLKASEARVTSVPFNDDFTAALAQPIYDLERVRVDLGERGQLVQFGWTPWSGRSNEPAVLELAEMGGFSATLRTGSAEGITRWLGEMNVKGYLGFVMGEGVCAVDPQGLVLEFSGLPAGRYRLKTYHHAPRSNTNSMDPNRERLRTLKIHEIPVAGELAVQIGDVTVPVTVTAGKELPGSGPGTAIVDFAVQGESSVSVHITDTQGAKGIWLNGFELQQGR